MPGKPTVLFVCLHGSAKSLIAARHLEQIARAHDVDVTCKSAGIEPDDTVPPHVVAGLSAEGIDVSTTIPVRPTSDDVRTADYVVSFGCDLTALGDNTNVRRWDDVPAVSDGYDAATLEIDRRVRALFDEITGQV